MKIGSYQVCVNVNFKHGLIQFATKEEGGLTNIVVDHQPVFKQGSGFKGNVEGRIMELTLIDHTTAVMKFSETEQYQIPYSSTDEFQKFIESDWDGHQYEYYKNKSLWQL